MAAITKERKAVAETDYVGRPLSWMERTLGAQGYRILKGLLTNPISVAGIVLLGFFLFVALAAPVLAPPVNANDPYQIPRDGYGSVPQPPGTPWNSHQPSIPFWWRAVTGHDQWVHVMGTASGQWDIYYGVVWGTRTALRVGVTITLIAAIAGITLGALSAFYGGAVDMLIMRVTDIFIAFPFLPATMTLAAVLTPLLGRGLYPAMIALTVFGWTIYARLLRSDILSVRQREYVLAAQVLGVNDARILLRHVLPNAIFPTLVVASMQIGSVVITFSALSFLGVGADVGYADWGQLLSFARAWMTNLSDYWYIIVYPGVSLVLFVLAWNLVGDALRDILDPRLHGSR